MAFTVILLFPLPFDQPKELEAEKKKVLCRVLGLNKEQADLEIVRICNGKINSHNRILIAEAFGIFSLLNLSKGKGVLITQIQTAIYPIFLTITYLALLALVFYSLTRSIHYSKMIDLALTDISRMSEDEETPKTETISKMVNSYYDQAQKSCPYPTPKILEWRKRTKNFIYSLAIVAAVFSVILWILILSMPI